MEKILLQDAFSSLIVNAMVSIDADMVLVAKAGLEIENRTVAYIAFFAYGYDRAYILKFDNQYCLKENKYIETAREMDAKMATKEGLLGLMLEELKFDYNESIL